jgi:hypothetical protein
LWSQIGSPTEHNQLNTHSEAAFSGGMSVSPLSGNNIPGLSSGYTPMRLPIGRSSNRNILADHMFHRFPNLNNSHSFPEHGGIVSASPLVSSAASSTSTASGFTAMARTPFLWGNKNALREHFMSSAVHSPPLSSSHFSNSHIQRQDSPYRNFSGSFGPSENSQYHVGSAPSVFPLQSNFSYYPESPDTPYMRSGKFGSIGPSGNGGSLMTNFGLRSHVNAQSMQSSNAYKNPCFSNGKTRYMIDHDFLNTIFMIQLVLRVCLSLAKTMQLEVLVVKMIVGFSTNWIWRRLLPEKTLGQL